jgi:hypothetical protein
MPVFYVKFENHPELTIDIYDTELGNQYYNLVRSQAQIEPPLFRDKASYTLDRLSQLVALTNELCNTNWHFDQYDLETTVQIHKLVETMVGQNTQGFCGIQSQYDELLHEIHFCLHEVQGKNTNQLRTGWIQIEWFNDAGFALPESFEFSTRVQVGNIRLQNPYVGHPPQKLYMDNDHSTIFQTCRFHDLVRPGICMAINNFSCEFVNTTEYQQWWSTHALEFVTLHGMNKILHYSGHPIVGQVRNTADLLSLSQSPFLKFECIQF